MTELRTLKDLIEEYKEGKRGQLIVFPIHLRDEAIKWIKDIREANEKIKIETPKRDISILGEGIRIVVNVEIINWIKHFFNITKDDLK